MTSSDTFNNLFEIPSCNRLRESVVWMLLQGGEHIPAIRVFEKEINILLIPEVPV
jgi:hypothetical protein